MILLIGNKCDLESKRTVASSVWTGPWHGQTQVARQYATSKGIQFFETSALTGANIKEVENYISMRVSAPFSHSPVNKKSNYDNINKEDYLQACELQIQILHLTSSLSVYLRIEKTRAQSGSENEQRKKREQLVNLNKTLLHTNYMKKVFFICCYEKCRLGSRTQQGRAEFDHHRTQKHKRETARSKYHPTEERRRICEKMQMLLTIRP